MRQRYISVKAQRRNIWQGRFLVTGRMSCWHMAAPRFAILDPAYTASVPRMQVISGAFDTLSHAMETYFGNSDQDNVSDDVALAIMRNTVVNMKRLMGNINDMQARGILMWDSASAVTRQRRA